MSDAAATAPVIGAPDPRRKLTADEFNWFLGITDQVARLALQQMRATGYAQHWLFFQPHGMKFSLVGPGQEVPPDFVKAIDDSLPSFMGRHALTAWLRTKCQTLPMFP